MNWRETAARKSVRQLIVDEGGDSASGLDIVVWYANHNSQSFETIATNFEPKSLDVPYGKGLVSASLDRRPVFINGTEDLKNLAIKPYHVEIAKKRNWRTYYINPLLVENKIIGAVGFYSRNGFDADFAKKKISQRHLTTALLALDAIRDYDRREGQIQKSLLAMDVGRVAEDRFHDIQEQLYGAIGAVGAIKADISLSPHSNIYKNAIAAETQIKRASGFTKKYIEESKNPDALRRTETDVNEIVKILWRELETRTKIRKANRGQAVDVRASFNFEPLICSVDIERFYRCLNNVIVNAEYWVIRSEKSVRRIDIVTEKIGGNAIVRVRDTGPGLLDVEKIFEPGYSLRDGTGLGLAIARKVLSLHGGEINASTDITQWTMFEILLPLVEKRK